MLKKMPYPNNAALPPAIKDNLPADAQNIFRATFNSVFEDKKDEKIAFATAWSVVRRNGYSKIDGKWMKREEESIVRAAVECEAPSASESHVNVPLGEKEKSEPEPKYTFKIEKTFDEGDKRIAFGFCVVSKDKNGQEIFDLQNDGIDEQELEDLAYRYVQFYRDAGSEHNSVHKGVLIESVVFTAEKLRVWGVPKGILPESAWWVGFKIIDDITWQKVKSGEYAAFSIEGSAIRVPV